MSKAVRLFPLAYGRMPIPSLRNGMEVDSVEENAAVVDGRNADAVTDGVRDDAKPSLRDGTLAIGCGGGAFLQDWRGGMQLTSP